MKPQSRMLIIITFVVLSFLTIVFFYFHGMFEDNPPIVERTSTETTTIADQTSTSAEIQSPSPAVNTDWKPLEGEFMADSKDARVLWKHEQAMIYVQNLQLYYTTDGTNKQLIYEWKTPLPLEAWLNGDYLLIGAQLTEDNAQDDVSSASGAWLAIRIEPAPVVIEDTNLFFGPHEVLSIRLTEEPRLFLLKVRNGSGFSEEAFDPSHDGWETINRGTMDASAPETSGTTPDLHVLTNNRVFLLPEGPTVYSFLDEGSSIVYFKDPHYLVRRYDGYELLQVKRIPFLEDTPQLIGQFRNQAGEEFMSFLNYELSPLPVEPRLWQEEWQAFNYRTFTHVAPDKLEILQYEDEIPSDREAEASAESVTAVTTKYPPKFTQFPTNGLTWIASRGSLVEYEDNGRIISLSWPDIINTEEAELESIRSSPLQNFTIKNENRKPYTTFSQSILEWRFEEDNTNAAVPQELRDAIDQLYREEDYSYAKTFRKIGTTWFVLIDRHFYQYQSGALTEIGELPVTVTVKIGEAAGGIGARDFMRWQGSWIVTDTEASRVLKLNDKLEITAVIYIPTPYKLTLKGQQLQIASTGLTWIVDQNLNRINVKSQGYQSTAKLSKVDYPNFHEQEWYYDEKSGITWYYLLGSLYQVQEKKKQYRSFYLSENENMQAHVRIIPYQDEVIVLLDRRLERFDRQGKRLGTIAFPRSSPDGIYDRTTQGENSYILDSSSDNLYLLQGYRILKIHLGSESVTTLFRQNYADLGELSMVDGKLYFLLHNNQNDRYSHNQDNPDGNKSYVTEVIQIDLHTQAVQRSITEGYYEAMTIDVDTNNQPMFVLKSYN
ncbi:hypothetical protein [Paenibacillus sp. CF384]|uniref:hypothetical protein n=1 Tax=Paenibacillus sp. CF384 TaxID=1884382 RepID=UPI000897C463|nr:hypothetical protein [Paenibacillus sp. CF384]SDW15305.1 hypothetical protein SAMN05518855_1001442 [Paenibacillus sp. CF384]